MVTATSATEMVATSSSTAEEANAHVLAIARRVRLTRYRSPGWPMAMDITRRLRTLDPADPVKYDFAFHRMGLWKRKGEIDSLR